MKKTGFGMIPIRSEGGPIHPDDVSHFPRGLTDDQEREAAFRYFDYYPNIDHVGLSYYEEWKADKGIVSATKA